MMTEVQPTTDALFSTVIADEHDGAATIEVTPVAFARGGTLTVQGVCRLLVDLVRRLSVARGERDVYRQMVGIALTQLHEQNIDLKRERESRFRLLADYRALRVERRRAR